MEHLNTVSNGGKTNVNGNLVYTTAIPHRNPVLCVIFARGLMLLYRWLCMGEPFPDLLEYKEYFKVHALRSESSQYVSVDYDTSLKIHTELHCKFGIHSKKKLHLGRREACQSADNDNIDIRDVERMKHALHTETTHSYVISQPMRGVIQAAGFDPDDQINVVPPDQLEDPGRDLEDALLPMNKGNSGRIETEIFGKTFAEAEEARLICARESEKCIRKMCRIILQRSAARPVNHEGLIQFEEDPLYMQLRAHNEIFQQPVFFTKEFAEFAARVSAREDSMGSVLTDHEAARRKAGEVLGLVPPTAATQAAPPAVQAVPLTSLSPLADKVALRVQPALSHAAAVGAAAGSVAVASAAASDASSGSATSVSTFAMVTQLRARLRGNDQATYLLDKLIETVNLEEEVDAQSTSSASTSSAPYITAEERRGTPQTQTPAELHQMLQSLLSGAGIGCSPLRSGADIARDIYGAAPGAHAPSVRSGGVAPTAAERATEHAPADSSAQTLSGASTPNARAAPARAAAAGTATTGARHPAAGAATTAATPVAATAPPPPALPRRRGPQAPCTKRRRPARRRVHPSTPRRVHTSPPSLLKPAFLYPSPSR